MTEFSIFLHSMVKGLASNSLFFFQDRVVDVVSLPAANKPRELNWKTLVHLSLFLSWWPYVLDIQKLL